MTKILSSESINIIQKDYLQVLLRGNGKDQFNQTIVKEISLSPPAKNLEVSSDDQHIFAKNSFDQWSLLFLVEKDYKKILRMIKNLNLSDEILASDYSYGQVYFEISGNKKNEFLNKLTTFDLRSKKFPVSTMAQTLIARVDCSIYNLKDKYIVTCNKSYEDYFKKRLIDFNNLS